MDRVSELYDTAEKSGIEVLSFPLPETGSLSIEQGGRCYIGIDSSRKLRPPALGTSWAIVYTEGSIHAPHPTISWNGTRSGPTIGTYFMRYQRAG